MSTCPERSQAPRTDRSQAGFPSKRKLSGPSWSRTTVALFFMLTLPSAVTASALDGSYWEHAAQTSGIDDPRMLYAIALAESGRTEGQGRLSPWPWALNIDGQAYFPASKDEAAALLAAHRDRSVDVGLLQINIRWHGHRVGDPRALLDPNTNLEIGAAVLKEALDSAPGDLTAGIGRYHSSDPERARSYARTVLGFYRYLIHDDEETRHAR